MHEPTYELETKFLLADAAALKRVLPELSRLADHVGPADTVELHDTYLDTEDWWLFRAGVACRIRRQKTGRRQAWLELKELAKPVGHVSRRMELSRRLPRVPRATATALPDGPLGRLVRRLIGPRRLRILFHIHNHRTNYAVRAGGMNLLVSADDVRFIAGSREQALVEVELEAKGAASPKVLHRLADKLAKRLGGQAAHESKFQLGLRLAGLPPPEPPPTDRSSCGVAGTWARYPRHVRLKRHR